MVTIEKMASVQHQKERVLMADELGVLPRLRPNQQEVVRRRYLSSDEVMSFRELATSYAQEGKIVTFQAIQKTDKKALRRIERELEGRPSPRVKQPTEEITTPKLENDYNLQHLTILQMARKYGVSDDTMRQLLIDNNISIHPSRNKKRT